MPLVQWKTSAWMSNASVISVYATSFCFTGLLCNILRAFWLLPASETKNTSCLHWIMEEWFVGALISREANFVFAKCKYTALAPILTIRLYVSMRGLWEGQGLTFKNLTLKKREDSKVFAPTPSDWNCSAAQNSVETRFTPKKEPWAPQVTKEVSCNINHMWASQMHNASNRPKTKKTRWEITH